MLSLKEIQGFRKVYHRVHRAGENMTNFFFNPGVKQLLQMIVITTTIISLWQEDVRFYISLKYIGKLGVGDLWIPAVVTLLLLSDSSI